MYFNFGSKEDNAKIGKACEEALLGVPAYYGTDQQSSNETYYDKHDFLIDFVEKMLEGGVFFDTTAKEDNPLDGLEILVPVGDNMFQYQPVTAIMVGKDTEGPRLFIGTKQGDINRMIYIDGTDLSCIYNVNVCIAWLTSRYLDGFAENEAEGQESS